MRVGRGQEAKGLELRAKSCHRYWVESQVLRAKLRGSENFVAIATTATERPLRFGSEIGRAAVQAGRAAVDTAGSG